MASVRAVVVVIIASACLTLTAILNQERSNETPHQVVAEKNRSERKDQGPIIKEVSTCPQPTRVSHYRDVCKAGVKGDGYDRLQYVILDHDRKTLGCLPSKVGTKSWLQYMVRSKLPDIIPAKVRNLEWMKSINIELVRQMPVSNVTNNYKSWTKYILVRHPIQRIVSAYHEAIVFRRFLTADDAPISFEEFAERLGSGELVNRNGHWAFYRDRCSVCDIDYDTIIKQESLNEDIRDFNGKLGIARDLTVELVHVNQQITPDEKYDQKYKYDPMLQMYQKEHPDTMQAILDVYSDDMKIFGYDWDWGKSQSGCKTNSSDGRVCC